MLCAKNGAPTKRGGQEEGEVKVTYEEKMRELRDRAKKEVAAVARVRKQVKIQAAEAENRVIFPHQAIADPAKRKQQSVPTIVAIALYWSGQTTFHRVDWGYPGCFACGDWSQHECQNIESEWRGARLERCHLVGKAEGGAGDVSNFVLLCKRCHRSAPMVGSSPQPMIDWINRQEFYVNRMLRRIEEEMRAIRPTLPEEAIALGLNDWEKLQMVMNVAVHSMNIGYHPDGDMIATGVAVLHSVVESLKPRGRSLPAIL